jgi:hypothetical protein
MACGRRTVDPQWWTEDLTWPCCGDRFPPRLVAVRLVRNYLLLDHAPSGDAAARRRTARRHRFCCDRRSRGSLPRRNDPPERLRYSGARLAHAGVFADPSNDGRPLSTAMESTSIQIPAVTYGPGRTWLTFHLHDIRVVGPNCIGLINTDPFVRFNATFALNAPTSGHRAGGSDRNAVPLLIRDGST